MNRPELRFGDWIREGFELFAQNLVLLVLSTLVALVISTVTFGLLSGPASVGLILIALRLHDRNQPRPEVLDILRGFDYFVDSFLFTVVWSGALLVMGFVLSLVPCLGALLALLLGFAVPALLAFGLFLIGDRKMSFWAASVESAERASGNFPGFLVLYLLATVLAAMGTIAFGIGIIFTAPLALCILTVAYRDFYPAVRSEDTAGTGTAILDPQGPQGPQDPEPASDGS